ncbi:MAG: hypothetical protein HQK65_17620 [Desulfamplus sp.]|nr:hypothetical protein [Desulfamplus sp.]
MNTEKKNEETTEQKMAEGSGSGSDTVQSTMERGSEFCGQAEQAVNEAYDKTSRKVNETYDIAKNYSKDNPGKTIFIALGIGVGLGFLMGAGSRHSRTGRFAEPVVNALSDIARAYFH